MASECSFDFTKTAENDLDGILDYISVKLKNPSAARNFFIELNSNISELCSFPQTGELVENDYLKDKSIRKVPINNYLLYYKYNPQTKKIIIIRIIYGKMNPDKVMREFDI